MATKKYESMRIMSLEGSVLYKNEGFTATKDGKPVPQAKPSEAFSTRALIP